MLKIVFGGKKKNFGQGGKLSRPIFVPRKHFSLGGGNWQPLGCEEKKNKSYEKKKVVSLEWSTIGGHPIVFFGRGKIEWPFGLYICVCMYVCIIIIFLKKVVSFGRKKTRWPPCCVLWEGENQVVIQFSSQGNN
jgi:hypothetical protein